MADLVTVNNLIDQNEAAAQELSTQVDHVLEAVSRIEQLLTTINSSIAPTNQKIQTNFVALRDSLETIENGFENEIQQAKETLNKVHQKVDELEGQVDEMANGMSSQLDELRSHTEGTLAEIKSEAAANTADLDKVTQQAQSIETQTESQGNEANESIASC